MEIQFTPVRDDQRLALETAGDVLIINGERFDFSELPEGSELPAQAISSRWFVGPVTRRDGELSVSLLLPHGAHAHPEALYPKPITTSSDGAVQLPAYSLTEV
jgi:hypothetical protein